MIIDIPSFQNLGHKGRIQVFFLNLTNIILLNDHQVHHVFWKHATVYYRNNFIFYYWITNDHKLSSWKTISIIFPPSFIQLKVWASFLCWLIACPFTSSYFTKQRTIPSVSQSNPTATKAVLALKNRLLTVLFNLSFCY